MSVFECPIRCSRCGVCETHTIVGANSREVAVAFVLAGAGRRCPRSALGHGCDATADIQHAKPVAAGFLASLRV